jgi:hypothetical protein
VELQHAMSNPLERWMHHTKTTVIDTADISIPTIGFQKQQLVIRLRALYGTDNNVSPLIPITAGKTTDLLSFNHPSEKLVPLYLYYVVCRSVNYK